MQDYYGRDALLDRLTNGVFRTGKPVVFLVGSALTAPQALGEPGIPGVEGVIDLILKEFSNSQLLELKTALAAAENPYQEAFRYFLGRRGPQMANGIIRAAVAQARKQTLSVNETTIYQLNMETSDEACRLFESDKTGWYLTPGVEALGKLAVRYPNRFGRTVLTTNFDPLIGAAAAMAGGTSFRTILHRDGNLGQTDGEGVHVVHLHGYWYGSDTLHTPRQLNQPRPNLKASLAHLLRDKIVVVVGYGGWDDVFTQALVEVVLDDGAFPEIIWTFKDVTPIANPRLLDRLEPGLSRGRVSLYSGIDCHTFIPDLVENWERIEPSLTSPASQPIATFAVRKIPSRISIDRSIPKWNVKEEDNPPAIEFYVGRNENIDALCNTKYRIAYITGMGGQGKSVLAAKYYSENSSKKTFTYRLWRDC